MRGEHAADFDGFLFEAGSSPHARGALQGFRPVRVGLGIIPACAGSTIYLLKRTPIEKDHPRMRGEHHEAALPDRKLGGSSPHARGAR